MNIDNSKVFAVIMAGGSGTRLWPLSRRKRPKQLVAFSGTETMIESTLQRLFPLLRAENVMVITNESLVDTMREVLPLPEENIIGEPCGRNTAPCVALATALVRMKCSDATIIMLSADHIIRPAKKFQEQLSKAVCCAQDGSLVTLGITPAFPATDYGYIHTAEEVDYGFRRVADFREKPDKIKAEEYFRDGNYLWNSGIFVWRADAISEEFRKYHPQLSGKLEKWSAGADFREDFAECENISIDYAIMEKAGKVIVGDMGCYWNDVGNWRSLLAELELDDNKNAVRGKTVTVNAGENVIFSDDDTLIGVIGVHDTAIIKSGNGILVYNFSDERYVKQLITEIGEKYPDFL